MDKSKGETNKSKKPRDSSNGAAAGKSSALSRSGPAGTKSTVKMADINLPEGERDDTNKLLSNQQIVEKILSLQKLALENASYFA